MSDAEHLIENVIYAMKQDRDVYEELDTWYNKEMLKSTGIKKEDVVGMAMHVVHSLYNGKYPSSLLEDD